MIFISVFVVCYVSHFFPIIFKPEKSLNLPLPPPFFFIHLAGSLHSKLVRLIPGARRSRSAVDLLLRIFDLNLVSDVSGMMQSWSLKTMCAESLLLSGPGLVWGAHER